MTWECMRLTLTGRTFAYRDGLKSYCSSVPSSGLTSASCRTEEAAAISYSVIGVKGSVAGIGHECSSVCCRNHWKIGLASVLPSF